MDMTKATVRINTLKHFPQTSTMISVNTGQTPADHLNQVVQLAQNRQNLNRDKYERENIIKMNASCGDIWPVNRVKDKGWLCI